MMAYVKLTALGLVGLALLPVFLVVMVTWALVYLGLLALSPVIGLDYVDRWSAIFDQGLR